MKQFFVFLSLLVIGVSKLIGQENGGVKELKSATDVAKQFLRPAQPNETKLGRITAYVNPFIGTGGHGHTYPGASAPFGMMQLSPDTRHDGWDGCSGYHYSDSIIYGFSHTHLSGTGVPDYCDLLISPQIGAPKTTPGYLNPSGYGNQFDHGAEMASPGYYAVKFLNGIGVELTVTERAGFHKYTFISDDNPKHILIDLDHRDKLLDADLQINGKNSITGKRISEAWAREQHFYFFMELSVDFESYRLIEENGQHKLLLTFPATASMIMLKVGMSACDISGAKLNLEKEIPHWDFSKTRNETNDLWENELSKIIVETKNKNHITNFYTALYHTFLCPNIFSDADGKYRGRDNQIHQLPNGETNYTVFSLWDTYRGTHPLFTILQQKRTSDFIKTFQRQFEQGGDLPVWELAGNETECMIGYHSVSVIADAQAKHIQGFDINQLITSVIATSNFDEYGKKSFNDRGFIGMDIEPESVSKTLEYAYNSYCIYEILKKVKMGGAAINDKTIEMFHLRSFNFVNSFDPQTGFMRARREGLWFSPFKPDEVNFNYTEANSWQYSLYAPHAIGTLSALLKGQGGLEKYLDRLFTVPSDLSGRHQVDITGLIGQYAHGNEPSHHMAYLYNYTPSPHKTAIYVDSILNHLYFNAPDGLSGNEDCGQMSAWYVLSALGFYPVSPGSDMYDFGRPIFDRAKIKLENGQTLELNFLNNSKENKFVQDVKMKGYSFEGKQFSHQLLMQGGAWSITMGNKPAPYEMTKEVPTSLPTNFTPLPYFNQENRVFDKKMTLSLATPLEGTNFKIFYTTNGDNPTSNGKEYNDPFKIKSSTQIKAATYNVSTKQFSSVISNNFVRKEKGISVRIETPYANQYAASGDVTLIDGITGNEEYRTGDWQGYWATDLRATVSFQKGKSLQRIGIHCLEDTKSWIFAPKKVIFIITYSDGSTETIESNSKFNNSTQNDQKRIHQYEATVQLKKVKSIKVVAVNFGKCPEWHLGAGNDTWIFADEIFYE